VPPGREGLFPAVALTDSCSVENDEAHRFDTVATGGRLSAALLGYFVLVTLVITLSPFDPSAPRLARVSLELVPADILANVALFLPLGFLSRGLERCTRRGPWRTVCLAAAFSTLIEVVQLCIHDRYGSPVDVATNTCGAYLGVVLRDRLARTTAWQPDLAGRLGLEVPLVGLLYLLLPQVWLNGVGLVGDARRIATTLLLGAAVAIVLAALVAARSAPGERRFEIDTLRRWLPVFSLYLVVAALWPPFRPTVPWHGALGFGDRLNGAGVVELLLLLEQVGGFTLLGYAGAEWRGRRELPLAADLPRLVLVALVLATGLELAQGVLAGPGASLARLLLSTSGAMYGACVYHLARAHVRALRAAQATEGWEGLEEAA
jgi:glycopeptide antibiotics resistance protein